MCIENISVTYAIWYVDRKLSDVDNDLVVSNGYHHSWEIQIILDLIPTLSYNLCVCFPVTTE